MINFTTCNNAEQRNFFVKNFMHNLKNLYTESTVLILTSLQCLFTNNGS
jgi:hypothetical protein